MSEHTKMRTHSGILIDLMHPKQEDITLKDIAFALSRIHRFNGHTDLTVAQHSIQVMEGVYHQGVSFIATATKVSVRDILLYALLHDAHEAYLGDITRPLKNLLVGSVLAAVSQQLQGVIHDAFGLRPAMHHLVQHWVKQADGKTLDYDRWRIKNVIEPWYSDDAEAAFASTVSALLSENATPSFFEQYKSWGEAAL